MSTDIERLLYSERQYLRSFDFTAEQSYHLEMRRRLNLALHLWGIVYGLELLQGEVVQGAPDQCYLSEGMAIDAYGREIIVSAKRLLSEDLDNNRITGTGTYSVWISYTREPGTPPEAAYQRCDLKEQYTRWRESFAIKLISVGSSPYPAGTNPLPSDPDPFGDLPDDPSKFPWWIHLGTINVDSSLQVSTPKNEDRFYIGTRTQRIEAPRDATTEFNILGADATHPNSPLKPLTSIQVRDNLFLEQNLIAGGDFAIDQQKILPAPPSTFPSVSGNVKIANDLFLQGNLYTHCDLAHPDLWLNLDQCIRARIKNSVPEVHIGTATIQFLPQSTGDASGTISASIDVTITTQLAQVDDAANTITTSIAGVIGKPPRSEVSTGPSFSVGRVGGQGAAAVSTNNPSFQIVTSGAISLKSDTTGTYNISLTCKVGPTYQTSIQTSSGSEKLQDVLIDSVIISYVVILSPKK
ncbi:MAG TPA: hypothetical protein VFO40_02860 [Chthoniobacterales bacterium]|nr:hypothetical protein [Chthoniobacterales bacterium]